MMRQIYAIVLHLDGRHQCSICGRACDVACYCHLEEKGVLTKKFRKPFRYRPEWKFPLSDFDQPNATGR